MKIKVKNSNVKFYSDTDIEISLVEFLQSYFNCVVETLISPQDTLSYKIGEKVFSHYEFLNSIVDATKKNKFAEYFTGFSKLIKKEIKETQEIIVHDLTTINLGE